MSATNDLGFALQHVAFILARQSDQVLLEQIGIGYSQCKILMVLKWRTDIQQRQIADTLGQTEASISRQIKLLLELGMLTSEISPRSRREHVIRLTGKGERVIEQALGILQSYHGPVFGNLSDKQKQQLHDILKTMHDQACNSDWPRACSHSFGE